jgi:hypothetical protein
MALVFSSSLRGRLAPVNLEAPCSLSRLSLFAALYPRETRQIPLHIRGVDRCGLSNPDVT